MEAALLLKGMLLGFSIAAPLGPIGLLCIRRTLAEGRLTGFVSGLGAATADAVFGSIAAFGLGLAATFLVGQQVWLRLLGGCFLIYLGLRTVFAPVSGTPAAVSGSGLVRAYASTLVLTLTNPITILAFTAIFAGFNLAGSGGAWTGSLALVAGIFTGSALWWFALSAGAGFLRWRLNPASLKWVNRLSGAVIIVFGCVILTSLAGWIGG